MKRVFSVISTIIMIIIIISLNQPLVYAESTQYVSYIRVCGSTETLQNGQPIEDGYKIVGNNNEYIFAMVYQNHKGERKFEKSGLYKNNATKEAVYTLPVWDNFCYADVSNDGTKVWIYHDSWLAWGNGKLEMTTPVLMKYIDGKLVTQLLLSDIYKSKHQFEKQPKPMYGYLWNAGIDSSDKFINISIEKNDSRESDPENNYRIITINKQTGKIISDSEALKFSTISIVLIGIVLLLLIAILFLVIKRCIKRKGKDMKLQ